MASGVRRWLRASNATGSPGMTRNKKKLSVSTKNNVKIAHRTLRPTYCHLMWLSPGHASSSEVRPDRRMKKRAAPAATAAITTQTPAGRPLDEEPDESAFAAGFAVTNIVYP